MINRKISEEIFNFGEGETVVVEYERNSLIKW